MQVMYLGRAPRTKETLPDFLKCRRVTRHPLVFRELTGCQQTPGFGASQLGIRALFLGQFFWTLFVDPVHEHCSSQIFRKKNIY